MLVALTIGCGEQRGVELRTVAAEPPPAAGAVLAEPTTTPPAEATATTAAPATTTTAKPTPAPKERRQRPTTQPCGGWEALVAAHFPGEQVAKACAVAWCESRGDPNATNRSSGASGLFQLMKVHSHRFTKRGWSWADRYDPGKNTAVAADLWREQSWRPWSCA